MGKESRFGETSLPSRNQSVLRNHCFSVTRYEKKTGEAQDAYVANPNMETADAYIQALQKTTMTLMDSVLMLAGPEFRKLMREELKANPGAN